MSRPTIYDSPEVQASCAILIKSSRTAPEHHFHLVITASQMEYLQRAVRLARLDAFDALEEEPHGAAEIQPDIDAFTLLASQLKLIKKSRKGTANEDWRGVVL